MAGRGGGRGRGRGKNITFNVESLGFGRGDALPAPILEPGPIYPIAPFKSVPLIKSEDQEYLVTVKQELRAAMKDSFYFIKPKQKLGDIERYSDKYITSQQEADKWEPDWKRLPAELQPKKKRKAKNVKVVPNIKKKKTVDFSEQLKVLEEKEAQGEEQAEEDEEDEEEKKKEDDQEEVEEDYDEEDLEEETDYNLTYFDNGENDDDDDDVDEGPIY